MGTHPIFESDFDCLTEKSEMNEDQLPEYEPEDDVIPDYQVDQLSINRIKAELKAEMKRGDSDAENQMYEWIGRKMKIKITDNRVLIGKFMCTDRDSNLILNNTEEFLTENKDETP